MARAYVIDRDKAYTPEACKTECGISREQLRQGRAAGVLKPESRGKRRFYKGSDLWNWVFRSGK